MNTAQTPAAQTPAADTPAAEPQPAVVTTVGVDVSKARLDACSDPGGERRSFANDRPGRRALRDWARRLGAQRVAMEPTGRYHRQLHQCLDAAGVEVVLVNPRRTRNFARSIGQEAKNDLADAQLLALFARLGLGKGSSPKKQSLQELADLVVTRRSLVKHRDAMRKNKREVCANAGQHMEKTLAEADRGINQLEASIEALLQADEGLRRRAEIIRSVPGCGLITAAVLCAELPELGEIGQAQAAALVGVAPYDQDSGQTRGARRIRGGRQTVRATGGRIESLEGLWEGCLRSRQSRPRSDVCRGPPGHRSLPWPFARPPAGWHSASRSDVKNLGIDQIACQGPAAGTGPPDRPRWPPPAAGRGSSTHPDSRISLQLARPAPPRRKSSPPPCETPIGPLPRGGFGAASTSGGPFSLPTIAPRVGRR